MKKNVLSNVQVIWKGQKGSKTGYIKLLLTQLNKRKVISLKIKVPKKDFNPSTQRIRTSNPDHIEYNNIIEEKVRNYRFVEYQKQNLSVVSHIEKKIKQHLNQQTRITLTSHLNLFKKFLKEQFNWEDISFEMITTDLVIDFTNYITPNRVNNTILVILSQIRTMLKSNEQYVYVKDPFKQVAEKIKHSNTDRKSLEISELKKLFEYKPIEWRTDKHTKHFIRFKLEDVKQAFIFSCLGQGLRISDIMTLRMADFFVTEKIVHINKLQFKTKSNVFITLNIDLLHIIEPQLIRIGQNIFTNDSRIDLIFSSFKENNTRMTDIINDFIKNRKGYQELLDTKLNWINDLLNDEPDERNNAIEKLVKETDEKMKLLNEQYNNEYFELEKEQYKCFLEIIDYLSNYHKIVFLYPFLNDKLFSEWNPANNRLTDEQQKDIVANRHSITSIIKKIARDAKIKKNVYFHMSRHTYTTLMLEYDNVGMNLNDLKSNLGHKYLSTTEKYIHSFVNKKNKLLTDNITGQIFSKNPATDTIRNLEDPFYKEEN
ncbi:MAG: tyrosine-type recombinase/integrase [Bacteroidota bacterium]